MKDNKDVSITIRIQEQEKESLKAIAKSKGVSLSQLVREAVKEYAEGAAQ